MFEEDAHVYKHGIQSSLRRQCQLQIGTCHLPLHGLNQVGAAAAADLQHFLKRVQGGEQK